MEPLPVKLEQEPLVDAMFEVRFNAVASLSSILPGIFYEKLSPKPTIAHLPNMSLPKEIRDADPALRATALVSVKYDSFYINIGESALTIGCTLPYPGWGSFKPFILQVIQIVVGLEVVQSINRYSMKYVDMIQAHTVAEQLQMISVNLSVGDVALKDQDFSLRLNVQSGEFMHYLNIVTSASVKLISGEERSGLIVDVDTIATLQPSPMLNWIEGLDSKLETIHSENKQMFFQCLRAESLHKLGPIYE